MSAQTVVDQVKEDIIQILGEKIPHDLVLDGAFAISGGVVRETGIYDRNSEDVSEEEEAIVGHRHLPFSGGSFNMF